MIESTVNLDQVGFGVEIECFVPTEICSMHDIYADEYHQGEEQWRDDILHGWKFEEDGSLNYREGYRAIEFVSPILFGKAGFDAVRSVYRLLFGEWDCVIDSSCGVHVTVGIGTLVSDSAVVDKKGYISRLVKLVSQNEDAMFGICNSVGRLNNHYCRSIRSSWSEERAEWVKDTNLGEWHSATNLSSRYSVLNLQHVNQGSASRVEFRAYAATTTAIKALGYVATSLGLVHLARVQGHVRRFQPHSSDQYAKAVMAMHKRFNWVSYRTTMDFKCGWPSGAFEAYGREVMRNQRSQARRFDERIGTR